MQIKFWGTRGSIPVPGPKTVKYGGNTPCVEVATFNKELILLDAGTGIREAGKTLITRMIDYYGKCHLFLSHTHLDHIMGFPFFAPAFNPSYQIHIYGALKVDARLGRSFKGIMDHLYFPIHLEEMGSNIHFHEILEEEVRISHYTTVTSKYLNHPQGVFGYRIENGGRSVVYATDNEINEDTPEFEVRLTEFARGADLLIMDAQYTPDEYKRKKGWGHSTYLVAARIAWHAEVGRLMLFHHDPDRTDEEMEVVVRKAREVFPRTDAAREGETIKLRIEVDDIVNNLYTDAVADVGDAPWIYEEEAPKSTELEFQRGLMYIAHIREIDMELIKQAFERIKRETENPIERLQIHLENVDSVNKDQISAIAEILELCRKRSITVWISGVEPDVYNAFNVARITEVAHVEMHSPT